MEEVMSDYTYERDARTPYSEAYTIEIEGDPIGRVDLHFASSTAVHATLCVPAEYDEDDIEDLIADIDERLVLSHDADRADFVVSVWRGSAAGVYSEDDETEEEGTAGNGRSPFVAGA
jgi:hypothetical protein